MFSTFPFFLKRACPLLVTQNVLALAAPVGSSGPPPPIPGKDLISVWSSLGPQPASLRPALPRPEGLGGTLSVPVWGSFLGSWSQTSRFPDGRPRTPLPTRQTQVGATCSAQGAGQCTDTAFSRCTS